MFGLGFGEWLVIIAAALLLFGPKAFSRLFYKLGKNAKSLGEEFKNGCSDAENKEDK